MGNFFKTDTKTQIVDPYAGTGVRELYNSLNNWISPQIGQSGPVYQGQMYAGASPLQNQVFANAGNYFNNIGNYGQYQDMGNQALNALMQPFNTQDAQNYWQQSFVNPAMSQWNDIQRGLAERFGGMDAMNSGGFNRSLSRAGSEFATNLSGQLGNIMYSGQQDYLNRLQNVPGLASQTYQLPQYSLNALNTLSGLGTQQQAISQGGLDEAYQKWQMGQAYNNPYLTNFLQTALAQPANEVIATQTPSLFSTMLNAGGMAAGAAAACDIRVKKEIAHIDSALDKIEKLDGKTYKYNDNENRRFAGVIAQDVEKVIPEAVEEINGVKYVRFDGMIALIVNSIKELNRKVG